MSVKLFWRKTNRGLWLGLVLLLALIVFIVVSEVSFGLQKKEINATAKDFAEALLRVNIVEGELGEDGYLTAEQKAKQKAALNDLVKQYWYSGSVDLNSNNYDLVRLNEILEQWQNEVSGKVTSIACQPEEWEVTIQRDGPGRVLVTVNTRTVEVRGEGDAPKEGQDGILFPTAASGRIPSGDGDTNNEWSSSGEIYFSFEMVRRNGRWQIAGMNARTGYGYYYGYGLLGMVG